MKVISAIEDEDVIKKILKHLGLWEEKARPPPKTRAAPVRIDTLIDDSHSQLPIPAHRLFGGSGTWLYVDLGI